MSSTFLKKNNTLWFNLYALILINIFIYLGNIQHGIYVNELEGSRVVANIHC